MARRRKPIELDETVEREPLTMDQFAGFVRELLQAGPPRDVKSENREPTKAEREKRFKFRWN
ncbi:MAG: hypothetical protein OXH15_16590 [Gammaproteobacteria bacterium]|nr:hypothetical protein [Gammaproteobacteria bacterium]